jgi:hypothetical protein
MKRYRLRRAAREDRLGQCARWRRRLRAQREGLLYESLLEVTPVMNRRSAAILGLMLFCGVSLWQVEAVGASDAGVIALDRHPVPVGPLPDVLCGCTEVLKNFA